MGLSFLWDRVSTLSLLLAAITQRSKSWRKEVLLPSTARQVLLLVKPYQEEWESCLRLQEKGLKRCVGKFLSFLSLCFIFVASCSSSTYLCPGGLDNCPLHRSRLRFHRRYFYDKNLYTHEFDSALHAHLQPKSITAYSSTLMYSARQHIYDILEEPSRHQDHAKRYVFGIGSSPLNTITSTHVITRFADMQQLL